MRIFLSLLLVSFITQKAYGQLEFQSKNIYYGNQEDWIRSINYFHFKNTGPKAIYLLRAEAPEGCQLSFPKEAIAPNSWAEIAVDFIPRKKGSFNHKITLYHSGSSKASVLKLKGSVQNIPLGMGQDCPDFSANAGEKALNNLHSGLVKDAILGKPIAKAEVLFAQNGHAVEYFKTAPNGIFKKELRLGIYSIAITAMGYDTLKIHNFYINRNTDPFVFELSPLNKTLPTAIIEKKQLEQIQINTEEVNVLRYYENDPRNPDSLQLNIEGFAPNNLIFLIDVSKSMKNYAHLDLIKKNIIEMIKHLRPSDQLSILTYADGINVLSNGRHCVDHHSMIQMVDTLVTRGSTQGRKGIKMAYKYAKKHFLKHGNNMIIVATDGGFNSLAQNQRSLYEYIKKQRNKGITLSALGIGKNEKGIFLMETMVKYGKGNYCHINTNTQDINVLISEIKQQSKQ